MKIDRTTIQWLNLLHSSPTFVLRIGDSNENATVKNVNIVPKNDGEYWIHGKTILKNKIVIPSVFIVDTNTGGSLSGVYWTINNIWWDFNNRPNVFQALCVEEQDVFPFNWTFSVGLEEDIYHP